MCVVRVQEAREESLLSVCSYQRQNLCMWALKYVLILGGRGEFFLSVQKALVTGEDMGKNQL